MQSINKKLQKELFILVIAPLILAGVAFFMYISLNSIRTKTNQIIIKEMKTEAETMKNGLVLSLQANKNLMDETFLYAPINQKVLIYYLNKYMSLAQKRYIQSMYFTKKDNSVLFLYPHNSQMYIPVDVLKDSSMLIKNINTAKTKRQSLYFNCSILDAEFKAVPAIMFVKPFFKPSGNYYGSVIEVIDLQKKLSDIFSYIEDYSAKIVPSTDGEQDASNNMLLYTMFKMHNSSFYISIKHNCAQKEAVLKNIHDIMLNLLFMIVISFVIIVSTAIILTKSAEKEILQTQILKKLNRRVKMFEETIVIQEKHLSQHSIKKILSMTNNVFGAHLSGIFLKDNGDINYTFDGNTLKKQKYLTIRGSISAYTWKQKRDTMINDFENTDFISDEVKRKTKVKSSICSLISFKEHNYGVICAGNAHTKDAFKEDDFDFLKLIAHSIAANIYHSTLSKNITETLLNSIDARDSYTEGHSRRVGEYARFIADILGFDEEFQKDIFTAGLFHDVGKIGIPDIILLKPTRLSPNEYEIMKLHSLFSYEILKNAEMLKTVITGIRGHHERWDGKGYPDGLSKENIPLTGRILAVADSFDAITTLRPYKSAMALSKTKQELIDNAGSQFDPDIIEKIAPHLKEMYDSGKDFVKSEKHFFPQFVENARKNIFYTDWFTGLMTMEYLETTINNLILKNMEFFICRIDIVNFSSIKYKLGRKKASDIILSISSILKIYIGSEIARTPDDIFTFIVKSKKDPTALVNEITDKIESETKCSLRFSYVMYPSNGKSAEELIYNLDAKHKQARKAC